MNCLTRSSKQSDRFHYVISISRTMLISILTTVVLSFLLSLERETGISEVQGHFWLHSEFKTSEGYVRPVSKQTNKQDGPAVTPSMVAMRIQWTEECS